MVGLGDLHRRIIYGLLTWSIVKWLVIKWLV